VYGTWLGELKGANKRGRSPRHILSHETEIFLLCSVNKAALSFAKAIIGSPAFGGHKARPATRRLRIGVYMDKRASGCTLEILSHTWLDINLQ
jgi:hypothetical protein